jgi:hypothetical protein
MSIIRKLAVSAASLIVGIVGITVLTAGPANSVADCSWGAPVPCKTKSIEQY